MGSDEETRNAWQRLQPLLWILVAGWFIAISAIRLSVLLPTTPGYDGMLYRDATLRWLAGGDPWAIQPGQAVFAAPPPTLLAMLPFAILPEPVARIVLVGLGIGASVWMIRRLRLPLWWLAFPPLVDGVYIANPHVFVVPLILAGATPIAILLKVYAGAVPVFRYQIRALAVTSGLFFVTVPILPWGLFIQRWPQVSSALASQADGRGFSVWGTPLLLPIAIIAAVLIGRERLAWWSVPVFWPYTQWYYSSMAMPVLTPLAAMALAAPVPGATTLGLAIAAVEVVRLNRRQRPLRPQPLLRPGDILET
jgi:hypothetical protein